MDELTAFEGRLRAGLEAYAGPRQAVDPVAIAGVARSRLPLRDAIAIRLAPTFAYGERARWPVLAVALLVLLAIVGGALVVGGYPFEREPSDLLPVREVVEPFMGLPPEGAPSSQPETGELVVSFAARVEILGLDVHVMWLYEDGRLIWKRNLEGRRRLWGGAFGERPPTTAVLEQRLTPGGVALIRSDLMASGIKLRGPKLPPGVIWGELRVRDGPRLDSVAWADPWLPERLTDPGDWLPAAAWVDRRTSAYVAAHYSICLPPNPRRVLPGEVEALLQTHGTRVAEMELNECYRVATDAARQIAASFVAAGIGMNESLGGLVTRQWGVSFAPMTPSGESICLECGRRQP